MRHIKTAATLILCIIAMQYLHELGHALTAKAFGYNVVMTINRVSEVHGVGYSPIYEANLVAAAGPAVTILIAVLAYWARARLGALAPIVIGNAMVMRLIASVVSFSSPNDEARLSANLGMPIWVLPVLVCTVLIAIFVAIARERKMGWQWYLAMWAGVSIGYSAVIMGESYFPSFVL
ncbi:hypothetical protein QWY75_10675 [Pontixanthobacter aestiaquae]|uniref:Peptidase family M50 n=1 Tax=Pontixanthobacter aestiaquae TaxID=1509367 RepID=A0A844Z4C9_9SPHN|nr:hypothetical protein [Pontixanthobacter aestiaquae]MDN3646663.1 hypothetical protein [Pontixanthobacter aestiaquae]MXO82354.1 hypothetical protein [Pontixanthobacter aestiaquae]